MLDSRPLRLSPSGPEMGSPPIHGGPGTTGLVFRAQGTSTTASGSTLTEVPGLSSVAFTSPVIPSGYHYDVEANFIVYANTTAGQFTCVVEFSHNAGGAWVQLTNGGYYAVGIGGGCIHWHQTDWDTSGLTADINAMRMRAQAPDAAGILHGGGATLRVAQYAV